MTVEAAVVGAGLAGLVATCRLKQLGVEATLFEATDRVGGRVLTHDGVFPEGQTAEAGGEFIGSRHDTLLRLVREAGLELNDLEQASHPDVGPVYHVNGERYSAEQARYDFAEVAPAYRTDIASRGDSFDPCDPGARELDRISVMEWIESRVPGGLDSKLGKLLDLACTVEYGANTADQSALNLFVMLGLDATSEDFEVFGGVDERFRIQGGSERLIEYLRACVDDQVELRHVLVRAASWTNGLVRLEFRAQGVVLQVDAKFVVLALPFRMLREIELTGLQLSELKQKAIAELGMGVHRKLHLPFRKRHWLALGFSGDTLFDGSYQCTWDETLGQRGETGILVSYQGGHACAGAAGRPAEMARELLGELEPILPGICEHWAGYAVADDWGAAPYQKGSYSYYRVGQRTAFGGIEAVPEGRVHFAGEHTCVEFQGYMEGAVRSGERAAFEIVSTLRR